MKSHARAPFAGSAAVRIGSTAAAGPKSRGLFGLACLSVLGLVAFLGTGAPSVGAAQSFPGQGFLPDNRAWEMVSPAAKNGGEIMGDSTRTRAAGHGEAVGFGSLAAFGDAVGTGIHVDYASVRGAGGWATHAITPPQLPLTSGPLLAWRPFYQGEFSSDLSHGVFRAFSPVTDAPNVAHTRNLYLRSDLLTPGAGSYSLLSDSVDPQPVPPLNTGVPEIADASADSSHVIFESTLNLTSDAFGSLPKVYEWEEGTLRLAGILPDASCGTPPCVAEGAAAGQGATGPASSYTQGTISDDGSRVFFTAPVTAQADPDVGAQLYMRIDHAETVRINASESATPEPAASDAFYEMATPDGSTVLFTSAEQLTNAPGSGLYAYDAGRPDSDPDNLTLVAAGDVRGVVGASDDGRRIYFVATDQLVPEAPAATADHLYLWDDGALRYVGTFDDPQDTIANVTQTNYALKVKPSRVAPEGRHVIFTSHSGSGLTGEEHSSGCVPLQGTLCSEVYLYDAEANGGAGELVCASCKASDPAATIDATTVSRAVTGITPPSAHLNRALSDDGRRVFFTSGERLVAEDKNGNTPDAYVYDTVAREVHLLSSGKSTSGSYFLDAGADGDDAFFITRERLVGWDVDNAYDLYNARVGGGFPEPPTPPAACSGADCRGAIDSAPTDSAVGTAALLARGNSSARRAKARRCAKGKRKVRRQGKVRCVKKKRASHNRRASR